jgi:hypothetical protein
MRRAITALLLLSTVGYSQQRSLPPERPLAPVLPGTVTLTLAEYNRLVELGAHKPKQPEAAPLAFVLSRAGFKLRVENDTLAGTLDIEGEVLHKGPVSVPLVGGLTILEAQQPQGPLPLVQEGQSQAAIINGPGQFSVSLKVAAAVTVEAGRASFTLPVPRASSSLLTLDLPGSHANVRIDPGLVTKRTTSDSHTIVEAALDPGRPARVWWTTREIEAPVAQREVRFLSDIKTLLSVGDSQLRIAALCDVTVVQGEPDEFHMPLPAGFEVTEVTGSTLDSSETRAGELILKVREPGRRTHQFLIAIERANKESKLDAPFLSLSGAQRETGELLVEGIGTMEMTAKEDGGLRRIDVREAGAVARSLARFPLQAAFRYHRNPGETPKLALEWNQFPDSSVLSAIAEQATITSLTNIEGKSLTEVTLKVRNHAQPFVKVELPQGASIVSAEVEGQTVKPVQGPDGSRVPLLRPGLVLTGPYTVSFVYLTSGSRFAKGGSYELGLPKLDVPISLLNWEVYLPDRLEVKQFGGNALAEATMPAGARDFVAMNDEEEYNEKAGEAWRSSVDIGSLGAGQIGGIVVDPNGAVVAGATISVMNRATGVTETAKTDSEGHWALSGMQAGPVKVTIASPGFNPLQQELDFNPSQPARLGSTLQVGSASETVTITASNASLERENRRIENQVRKDQLAQLNAPSQNVANLQKRVSGILPVRVDVPRGGKSYRFVRPLVMGEETKVTFQYKSK